jgi:hypothetical protein
MTTLNLKDLAPAITPHHAAPPEGRGAVGIPGRFDVRRCFAPLRRGY